MLNPHIKPMLKLSQTRQKKPDIDGLNPIPRKEHHLLDIALFQACESSGWPLGILHSTSHALRARGARTTQCLRRSARPGGGSHQHDVNGAAWSHSSIGCQGCHGSRGTPASLVTSATPTAGGLNPLEAQLAIALN